VNTRAIWAELFPGQPYPGDNTAVDVMADEIHSLRLLTETIVAAAIDEQQRQKAI
jgi:hypothetical protein